MSTLKLTALANDIKKSFQAESNVDEQSLTLNIEGAVFDVTATKDGFNVSAEGMKTTNAQTHFQVHEAIHGHIDPEIYLNSLQSTQPLLTKEDADGWAIPNRH